MCRSIRDCDTQIVTHAPSGVVITSTDEVYAIASYAKVYLALHQPPTHLQQETREAVSQLRSSMSQVAKRLTQRRSIEARLADIEEYFVESSPSRIRRAPLGFVGEIASSIFGTQALADANKLLADSVEGVIAGQRQIIG